MADKGKIAAQRIVICTATDHVVGTATGCSVVADTTIYIIIARATVEIIGITTAKNPVVAVATADCISSICDMTIPGLTEENFRCNDGCFIAGRVIQFSFKITWSIIKLVRNRLSCPDSEVRLVSSCNTTPDQIIAAITPEIVITIMTDDKIVPRTAKEEIVAWSAIDVIGTAGTCIGRTST